MCRQKVLFSIQVKLLSLIFATSAFATPAPKKCVGSPPEGFEAAYPSYPIGYLSLLLLVACVILIVTSHIYAMRTRQDESATKIYIGTGFGVLNLLGGCALFMLFALMGVFRNDCMFCKLGRPLLAFRNELLVVFLVLGFAGILIAVFRYLRSPSLRHGLTMSLILLGFIGWFSSVRYMATLYISTYCQ